MRLPSLQILAMWAVVLCGSLASAAMPSVAVKTVSAGELQAPVCLTNAGDGSGRLFVCELRGQIRIIQNDVLLPQVFLDLSSKVVPFPPTSYRFPMDAGYDERGLLGLAFPPGFGDVTAPGYRRFYVLYCAPSPNARGAPAAPALTPSPVNCRLVISQFRVTANANIADPGSERVLLTIDKPQANHNGGQIEFGPDGRLYFSVGDGGGGYDTDLGHTGANLQQAFGGLGNGQDTTNLMGKIHRIEPWGTNGPGGHYGIPPDNPFAGATGGVRQEIYAYGLRNVWRFSFDDGPGGTRRLFAADVGQSRLEEIDIITVGGNYGWRAREGTDTVDSTLDTALVKGGSVRVTGGTKKLPGGAMLIPPIAQYAHPFYSFGSPPLPQLGTSITGGYVYRGTAIPGLKGKYVFGDYYNGTNSVLGSLLAIEESSPNVWSAPAPIVVAGTNPLSSTHVLAFGRDEQNEIYVATEVGEGPRNNPATGKPGGALYKIIAPPDVRRPAWVTQYFGAGQYVDDLADLDGDGLRNLAEYAFAFNPRAANPPGTGLQVSMQQSGFNEMLTLIFRRDPRATDLTYNLQTSPDMIHWTTIVQSVAGGPSAGAALVSETTIAGQAPVMLVTARQTLTGTRWFARVQIVRP